ncbi:hypothetical protein KQ941_03035 [Paenibacillus xylanexedens]|uniref:hypothetical protein n=1 Tax=Paenibacillus xylanexedens TaxID=528191 RepID=UPI001F1F7559|nr:hypothetical protein [Paenibacillus xylanexedens]MCF7753404.1 hypothetical protein [Paenibacillus xylanexedens]
MKKGHPFMLVVPLLGVTKIQVGKELQFPNSEKIIVHSIDTIEIKDTKATIIGFTAR